MSKKAFTTADDILALVSLAKIIEIDDIPDIDGTFFMRVITDRERDEYELHLMDRDGKPDLTKMKGYRPRLLALCLVDQEGKRLFANGRADGLSDLPSSITVPLYEHAERINQLGDHSKTADEDAEAALKKA